MPSPWREPGRLLDLGDAFNDYSTLVISDGLASDWSVIGSDLWASAWEVAGACGLPLPEKAAGEPPVEGPEQMALPFA